MAGQRRAGTYVASGLIGTFGIQTFRESAHILKNVVGRFTEQMGLIRSDRTTSGPIGTLDIQTFRESAHIFNIVVGSATGRPAMPAPPSRSVLLGAVADARRKWGPPPPGLKIEVPGPGQESVWDYPRPPRFEPVNEPVSVVFNGAALAETNAAWRMCETAGAPVYYLPLTCFPEGALVPLDGWTICEWKGACVYYDLAWDGQRARQAAYRYPDPLDDLDPNYGRLADMVSIYPGAISARDGDGCFVSGERARPQPGGYYGGWVLDRVTGPIKGAPGSEGW